MGAGAPTNSPLRPPRIHCVLCDKAFSSLRAPLSGKPQMNLPAPPLLVISDRLQARRPLLEIAEAAFRGGCRWFRPREKDLPAAEPRDLLRALVVLGHRFGATITAHED